jgi:hypothetical protein
VFHHGETSRRVARAPDSELLLRVVVFAALMAAGAAAVLNADAWWTTGLAIAALAFATAGALLGLAALVGEPDASRPARRSRPVALILGALAVAGVVLAFTLPEHSKAARELAAPTAPAATETVRQFLEVAVVQDNAYLACQYLTPVGQRQVARVAGPVPSTTCREALTATHPAFRGVGSVGAVKALDVRAAVHGDRATVTVSGNGAQPVTFGLRRATPAELDAYEAPQVPWRIDSGATAVIASRGAGTT